MKRTQTICLLALLALTIHYVGSAQETSKPPIKPSSSLDFSPEEAKQLKEILTQRELRSKEAETAGQAITSSKTDDDMVKSTLRYQLAQERLTTLQVFEALVVTTAKLRLGCAECVYEGGTLKRLEKSQEKAPKSFNK